MNDLAKYKIYVESDNYQREKEDFTYTLFKDLNFNKSSRHVSFFRSDFRGSKFLNVKFYRNNFDRADFIKSYFKDCDFNDINIASSEFKGCYFSNVRFVGNTYNNTSIQECIFENCVFPSEQFLVNMKRCTFIKCIFSNCSFERSTTEKLIFDNCQIENTDLATMHAEGHSFVSCTLKNVCMGISYIFGYLLYNTNIQDVDLLYRGEKVSLPPQKALKQYARDLLQEGRYFEYLNAALLLGEFEYVPNLLEKSLTDLLLEDQPFRQLEITNIFEALIFYGSHFIFPFITFRRIIEIIDSFSWEGLPLLEQLEYSPQSERLKLIFISGEYPDKYVNSATGCDSLIAFHCETDDINNAVEFTNNFLLSVCKKYDIDSKFQLIDARKGSWILLFSIPASLALLVPTYVKYIQNITLQIKTKSQLSKAISNSLADPNIKLSKVIAIAEAAKSIGLVDSDKDGGLSKVLPEAIKSIKIGI